MSLLYAARRWYLARLSLGFLWLAHSNGQIGFGPAVVAAGMEARCSSLRVRRRAFGARERVIVAGGWSRLGGLLGAGSPPCAVAQLSRPQGEQQRSDAVVAEPLV